MTLSSSIAGRADLLVGGLDDFELLSNLAGGGECRTEAREESTSFGLEAIFC